MLEGYVAKYLRISDDDEDIGEKKSESDSIGNQRKVLEYYIKNHQELSKYPLKEFLDDGFSGVNFQRPGVQKLLKEVKEKRVTCIVVKDDCVNIELKSESPQKCGFCDVSSVF